MAKPNGELVKPSDALSISDFTATGVGNILTGISCSGREHGKNPIPSHHSTLIDVYHVLCGKRIRVGLSSDHCNHGVIVRPLQPWGYRPTTATMGLLVDMSRKVHRLPFFDLLDCESSLRFQTSVSPSLS